MPFVKPEGQPAKAVAISWSAQRRTREPLVNPRADRRTDVYSVKLGDRTL